MSQEILKTSEEFVYFGVLSLRKCSKVAGKFQVKNIKVSKQGFLRSSRIAIKIFIQAHSLVNIHTESKTEQNNYINSVLNFFKLFLFF